MKNVRPGQLKTAVFLNLDEFSYVVRAVFGNGTNFETALDGITVYTVDEEDDYTYLEDDEICEKLATYFDVAQVTSFHADDCKYPGIWIVYKDKIDK